MPSDTEVGILEVDNSREIAEYGQHIGKLRGRYPKMKLIAVVKGITDFPVQKLIGLGADAAFISPLENDFIIDEVFETSPIEIRDEDLTIKGLTRVNVIEIEGQRDLPFNLYVVLPSNKKILLYRKKDTAVEEKMIQRFKSKDYNLYIKKSDLKIYHAHCSGIMSQLLGDKSYFSIDKKKKVQNEVNQLIKGFLDKNEDTQQIVNNMSKILSHLHDKDGDHSKVLEQVSAFTSEYLTNHSHARNVATYSAMFGLMLGYNSPQSLRLGGMIHDIGLVDLADDLVAKEPEEMDEEEWAQYQLHPGSGKFTLEQQKLELLEGVMEMVVQHHEQVDGGGYPYQLKAADIHPFAKICAFADEFDKLTSVRLGHRQLTPIEAIKRISGLDGKEPSKRYDTAFHYPLVKALLADSEVPTETPYETYNPEMEAVPEATGELMYGAINGNLDSVEKLVRSNGSVNVVDEDGRTALMHSVANGHDPVAIRLIDGGAELGIADADGNTVLHLASRRENLYLVRRLLDESPELATAVNKDGQTPQDLAKQSQNKDLITAFSEATSPAGDEVNKSSDENTEASALDGSLTDEMDKVGKVDVVAEKTKKANPAPVIEVGFRNKRGQTYAHLAADQGRADLIEKFIKLQGDVNARDFNGRSPLFYACMKGHENVVDLLLSQNIKLGQKDDQGQTALTYAIQAKATEIAKKLIQSGEKVDHKIKGMTPLMMAAFLGLEDIVNCLIAAGADSQAKDYKGRNAHDYALSKGHESIAKRLNPKLAS